MRLGQKIADLRKKDNLSQEELAEKMHVSRQAVSKWESNQSIPDIEKIVDLSELFGVTTDYLLKNGTPSFDLKDKSNNSNEQLPTLTDEQVENYLTINKKSTHFKSMGCNLSVLGLAFFFGIFDFYEITRNNIFFSTAIASMFIIWAFAAGCFIYGILLTRDFQQIKRKQFVLKDNQIKQIQIKQKDFQHQNNKRIIVGVILCILAVYALGISSFWEFEAIALTIFLFSIAIYQFVFYRLQQTAFMTLTQQQRLLSKQDQRLLINITIIYWFVILICLYLNETYLYNIMWDTGINFTISFFGFLIYVIFVWFFFQKKARK